MTNTKLSDILHIVVCPACKSNLRLTENKLICTKNNCRAEYRIKDGIPILLLSQKTSEWAKDQTKFFDRLVKAKRDNRKSKITEFDRFFVEVYNGYIEQGVQSLMNCIQPNSLVLDCGCGDGRFTQLMLSTGKNLLIIGMDISFESVEKAKSRIYKLNRSISDKLHFIVGDINFIPFNPSSFHVIAVINLLHHLSNPQISLQHLSRCAANDGYMLNIEVTSNNPLNSFLRKIFPLMPKYVKDSVAIEDLVINGKIPKITGFKACVLKNYILSCNLRIIKAESHSLFLYILGYASQVFPLLKYAIPYVTLVHLYKIERKILSCKFFERFGGVAMYISKKVG